MKLQPEEGSQYWVAPFVTEYIRTNMILVSAEWEEYLREKTIMGI